MEDNGNLNDTTPHRITLVAGPCSAESEEQIMHTAHALATMGVDLFRAGVWKPRTKPGQFEGMGATALPWLRAVQEQTGMRAATEVANAQHVEQCLSAGIRVLWIGARTTGNPFAVQEVAEALRGTDVEVLVKNPISPDIELWIGAMERLQDAGVRSITAVHRGFASGYDPVHRNTPLWHIPVELRRRMPHIPLLCDPSHMGGRRDLILQLSQQAMDMGMDGLMIECHTQPDEALSDAAQQITPDELKRIMGQLIIRHRQDGSNGLEQLRCQIDDCDDQLMQALARRMQVSREICAYKKQHHLSVLQMGRYKQLLAKRCLQGEELGMPSEFVRQLYELIHEESVRQQMELMSGNK